MQLVHWVLGEVKPEDVGKTIERVFRCLAALTEALTKEPGPKFGKAHDAHFDSLAALGSVWERLNQRSDNASEPFEKAACAKEWLIASFEKDAFAQMQALMNTIRKQAAIVTSRSQSSTARYALGQCLAGHAKPCSVLGLQPASPPVEQSVQ